MVMRKVSVRITVGCAGMAGGITRFGKRFSTSSMRTFDDL